MNNSPSPTWKLKSQNPTWGLGEGPFAIQWSLQRDKSQNRTKWMIHMGYYWTINVGNPMIILLLALKTGQGDQTNLLVDIYGKKGSLQSYIYYCEVWSENWNSIKIKYLNLIFYKKKKIIFLLEALLKYSLKWVVVFHLKSHVIN